MTDIVGWAVTRTDGRTVADFGPDMDEKSIWVLALGWPSAKEIEWQKARGARAFRCRLEEIT